MVEGLTGAPIHPGSWFGLPDIGLTETISNALGLGTNAQGGSQITSRYNTAIPTQGTPYSPTVYNPNPSYTGSNYSPGQTLGATTQNTYNSTPSGNTGNKVITHDQAIAMGLDVNRLPAGYSLAGGGGGGGSNQLSAQDLENMVNEYNGLKAQIEARRPQIQGAYDVANQGVDTQINQALAQGQTESASAQQGGEQAQNEAYQNYLTTQRMNREAARAAGGESSAYLDVQGQARNAFNNMTGNIGQTLQTNLAKISTGIQAVQSWGVQAKAQLANTYQQGLQQITLDENATDLAKAKALSTLKDTMVQRQTAIDTQIQQFQNQLEISRQQTLMYAQLYGGAGASTSQALAKIAGSQLPTVGNAANTPTGFNMYGINQKDQSQNPYMNPSTMGAS